jgi:hypothetical protein
MIPLLTVQWHSKQCRHGRELTSFAAVYNTLHSGGRGPRTPTLKTTVRRVEP